MQAYIQQVEDGIISPPEALLECNPNEEIKQAVRDTKVSKMAGKHLKRTMNKLQDANAEAWSEGRNMDEWVAEQDCVGDGLNQLNAFGPKPSDEDFLIGSGKWLRIRNGITMDSGSSVFVIPSGWLIIFPRVGSEGSCRKQFILSGRSQGGQTGCE